MKGRNLYNLIVIFILLFNPVVMNSQSNKDSIVTISSITIVDKPASAYKGVYKNGRPYDGYFKVGDRDFFRIDFYKKGKRKYQYSFDYLKNIESSDYEAVTVLDIKSTYKNGKIFDGEEYITVKDGIVIKKWHNGKLNAFSLDLFAKHYFNRIFFDKKRDTLIVHNLQDKKSKAKSYYKNGFQVVETYMNNTLIAYKETVDYTELNFPKNSQISSFQKNGIIKSYAYRKIENKNVAFQDKNMNASLLSFLDSSDIKNMDAFFDHLANSFVMNKKLSTLFDNNSDSLILGYFDTNMNGKIHNGIRWMANTNEGGSYKIYKDGISSKEKRTTLLEFQTILKGYFKQFVNTN